MPSRLIVSRELADLLKLLAHADRLRLIEELRLGERLKIEWHTDKAPMQAIIPPLILQPLPNRSC